MALQLGRVSTGAATRLSLLLAAITFAVLVPLDYLWFGVLGLM